MRKYFYIISIVILIIVIVFSIVNYYNNLNETCKDFIVKINNNNIELTSEQEIKDSIAKKYGQVVGKPINKIDVYEIEKIIQENVFVKNVTIFKSVDSKIIAEIEQRKPLVRVFTENGKSFLIDSDGDIIPVPMFSRNRLITATGMFENIANNYINKNIYDLDIRDYSQIQSLQNVFTIATEISKDSTLTELISQIVSEPKGMFYLIPCVGNFIIFLGRAEDLENKLEKVKYIYSDLVKKTNVNLYKMINLSVRNQIICKKNYRL